MYPPDLIHLPCREAVATQTGLFILSDHLKWLSANGDPLEDVGPIVDFEGFLPILENALAYSDGSKGGRPPYDCVAMFKILILAAQSHFTDGRMEYLIRHRLSWKRFDLRAPTPDAHTLRQFREKLTDAGTLQMLFAHRLITNVYLAMAGTGRRYDPHCSHQSAQYARREGRNQNRQTTQKGWSNEPAKAAQKYAMPDES